MNSFTNTNDWKEFKIGDFFQVSRGKRIVRNIDYINQKKEEFVYPVITSTTINNGIDGFYHSKNCNGNSLVCGGEASGLFTTYQECDCWVMDSARIFKTKENMKLNKYIALFLITIFNQNQYKYSYGRKANPKEIMDLNIKLPVTLNNQPDWEFMENYINQITVKYKHKVQTLIKPKKILFNTLTWKEFKLSNYFNMESGKFYYAERYEHGNTPYVSASNLNNGIAQRINLKYDFKNNAITIGKISCATFYQSENFCATSDVTILKNDNILNKYIGLFIITVINLEGYKWKYGRQIRLGDCQNLIIKLPNKNNQPDWEFMENYIKKLPYSDKI